MRGRVLLVCLPLAACGGSQPEAAPGAATADEARALDEAAEMIVERRVSPEQLRHAPAVDIPPSQGAARTGAQGDVGQ